MLLLLAPGALDSAAGEVGDVVGARAVSHGRPAAALEVPAVALYPHAHGKDVSEVLLLRLEISVWHQRFSKDAKQRFLSR